jgi:hypothetical protein
MTRWESWINGNWARLAAGAHLRVPRRLPHPGNAGFTFERFAEDHGQVQDWTCPISDGSRLHVHVHRGGLMVLHRDEWDPGVSPLHTLVHVATETQVGRIASVVGLTAAAYFAIKKAVA